MAYQAALSQAAWDRGLPVRAMPETRAKRVRIEAAAVQVSRGRVLLPVDAGWTAQFRSEAADFPAGRDDDQLDAFARAMEAGLSLAGSAVIDSAGARGFSPAKDGFAGAARTLRGF